MKVYNRKVFASASFLDEFKERSIHIEDGIKNDRFIPQGMSFNTYYNNELIKRVTRICDFFKKSEEKEIEEYLKNSDEIIDLNKTYNGLYEYSPSDLAFKLIFVIQKGLIRDDQYYFLSLENKDYSIDKSTIKEAISKCYEWKREYTPTEKQKLIANYNGNNIVLGAAGTGKTDVAIHSYINSAPINNIKDFSFRDDSFITFSKKLSTHVYREIDNFFGDSSIEIKKNVFTTNEFFINVLKDSNIEIDGYKLENGRYIKNNTKNDYLDNNIPSHLTFISWCKNGYSNMNKSFIPSLDSIINKYGYDYPYLFFRGIFKGKVINKVSDELISDFFLTTYHLNDSDRFKGLLDLYLDSLDEDPSLESFKSWYNVASKRYHNEFKSIPSNLSNIDDLYDALLKYVSFATPIKDCNRYLEYYSLFKRELILIEGYRGETREEFDSEINVLYEMCNAYNKYLDSNSLIDDNDLCYIINKNMDKILSKGYFKNIIVDEFQDMTEREIHTLVKLLNDSGVIHIFGDFEQTINPTFLQLENIETIYMVNGIEDYSKQILSSSFRYSSAICKELEALREMGKKLFGTEDQDSYIPLESNVSKEFETGGNLLFDKEKSIDLIKSISQNKNIDNIMFIVGDDKSKESFINEYKINPDKVFTISESKGREEDFVIVYNICSDKSSEYENIFSNNNSYSRAGRIFYNQLYVGITRCKINFLQIESGNLGCNTKKVLSDLIQELIPENYDLFKEELLSQKTNYYFRARDSFKNLDFKATSDNLSFYTGQDFDDLRGTLSLIDKYMSDSDGSSLYSVSNTYKAKKRYDLARVLYIILDNNDMLKMLDLIENNINIEDDEIKSILFNNKDYISESDIYVLSKIGYFDRKKNMLSDKIKNIKNKGVI